MGELYQKINIECYRKNKNVSTTKNKPMGWKTEKSTWGGVGVFCGQGKRLFAQVENNKHKPHRHQPKAHIPNHSHTSIYQKPSSIWTSRDLTS